MTGAMCVRCRRWADNPVMVGAWASSTGAGWSQYAHAEGDPACGQPPPEVQGQGEEPAVLYDRGQARGAHRRPRRILDDLPRGMPGALVAAFGLVRRHAAAVALVVVVWPIPGWLVAPQAVDAITADGAGQSVPELPPVA